MPLRLARAGIVSLLLVLCCGVASAAATNVAVTTSGISTGASTATFSGWLNTGGSATSYSFEYANNTSTWCSSYGASGSPDETTATQSTAAAGQVSVTVSDLTPGATYCFELAASASGASSNGGFGTVVAGLPQAAAASAAANSATTAVVSGTVDPTGQATTYQVAYDTVDSNWCLSAGASGSATYDSAQQSLSDQGISADAVTADLTGLTAGQGYCAEITAQNSSGAASSSQVTFVEGVPTALTANAIVTSTTTATVSGEIGTEQQDTSYVVDYDLESSDWCASSGLDDSATFSTGSATVSGSNDAQDRVEVTLTGLTGSSEYCAELVATNASGQTSGGFVTLTAGLGHANTQSAVSTSTTSATLQGEVTPISAGATYDVEYDLASSSWCQTSGVSGPATYSSAPTQLNYSDAQAHPVAIGVTGLTKGAQYCAAIALTNPAGTALGGIITFTAGGATAVTGTATSSGPDSEQIASSVDPANQLTTALVQYDLASSSFCQSDGAAATYISSQTSLAAGTTAQPVTTTISNLTSGTRYCAQIVAENTSTSIAGNLVWFTAGAPNVSDTQIDAGTSATSLSATVNGAGAATSYDVAYDLASSNWCQLGTGQPTYTTNDVSLTPVDADDDSVSVDLPNLQPGTAYCAEMEASNAAGTSTGGQVDFGTAGLPIPIVTTGVADSTSATVAAVEGVVDPNGQDTTYQVDYGTTTDYGSNTTPQPIDASTGATDVEAELGDLAPDTLYHYRLEATNASGTTYGTDQTFTTAALPPAENSGGTTTSPVTTTGTTATPPVTTTGTTTAITTTSTTAAPAPVTTAPAPTTTALAPTTTTSVTASPPVSTVTTGGGTTDTSSSGSGAATSRKPAPVKTSSAAKKSAPKKKKTSAAKKKAAKAKRAAAAKKAAARRRATADKKTAR